MAVALLVSGLIFLRAAGPARAAAIYKYKDERGVTHFVEDKSKVPARYQKGLEEVDAELGAVQSEEHGTGIESVDRAGDRLGSVLGLSGETAVTGSRLMIVLRECWRSRLGFSLAFVFFIAAVLAAGLFLARDIARPVSRRRYRLVMAVSAAGTMVFLWLSVAGPEALSFFQGCQERSEEALALKDLRSKQREALARFQQSCSNWEERMEKIVASSE